MENREKIRWQWIITIAAIILFIAKIIAWQITGSVAILTDALESTINIVSAFIGIYSLTISARPKDYNHPYGHGKAEFLSAAIEGVLIIFAGLAIITKAVKNLWSPVALQELDKGIVIVLITAVINFILGFISVKNGRRHSSLTLIAGGRHLQSDTYSTLGIIAGLVLIRVTGSEWIDSAVAILFSFIIIYTGSAIMRKSVAGIMDEADEKLLEDLVEYLNTVRRENWIDLHNLRIIKYGSVLHLDCHLTVPWFLNVNQAHSEVEELSRLIREKYGSSVELFVHTDGCLEFSCKVCTKEKCNERQHALVTKVHWNLQNLRSDKKHHAEEGTLLSKN